MWGEWRLIVRSSLLKLLSQYEACFGLVIDKVGGVSVLHNNTAIILDLVNVDLIYYYNCQQAWQGPPQPNGPNLHHLHQFGGGQGARLRSYRPQQSQVETEHFSCVQTSPFSKRKTDAMSRVETLLKTRPPLKLNRESSVPYIEGRLVKLYLGKNY